MDLIQRPRRLRGSENLRKMARETRMDKSSLFIPFYFCKRGNRNEEEILLGGRTVPPQCRPSSL